MCGCKNKCGCNTTSTTKGEKGDANSAANLGYKEYTALLTQTGTNAPSVTVLKNTLGVVPVWSRQSAGNYFFTYNGLFLDNKTFLLGSKIYINIERSNDDAIVVNTVDSDGITPMDDILSYNTIEIRVYP